MIAPEGVVILPAPKVVLGILDANVNIVKTKAIPLIVAQIPVPCGVRATVQLVLLRGVYMVQHPYMLRAIPKHRDRRNRTGSKSFIF